MIGLAQLRGWHKRRPAAASAARCEPLEARVLLSGAYTLTTLATFDATNGSAPYAGLIADSGGNLYGTTQTGGANNDGTVFEVAAVTHVLTTLVSFDGANGESPQAGLIFDSGGNLYGTTKQGGADGEGTVFEVAAGTHVLSMLYSFTGGDDGGGPNAALIFDSGGNLYGTTQSGGADNDGTIFELAAGTDVLSTLHSFAGGDEGAAPDAGLIFDADGNLYGTTSQGGADNDGTVFELADGTEILTTLITFTGTNGAFPVAGLIADGSGNMYGTTYYGGTDDDGTVFELAAGTHALTTLVTFDGSDGEVPTGGLILDADDNLYGTTRNGDANNDGCVFEVAAGTEVRTTLTTFSDSKGSEPVGSLIFDANGNLYGTANQGGADGDGVVFEVSPSPTQLAFVQQPSDATAGVADSPAITVDVENSLGNIVNDNSSNVTLSVHSNKPGAVRGTVTVAAVNGVATFSNVILDASGLYTLKATDGSLAAATSSSFTVSPAPAPKLIFAQQPRKATAGVAVAPAITVNVEDALGNIVTADSSDVTLAVASGPGVASGTLTVAAVDGVATFSDVVLNTAGTYTLIATDGGYTSATSFTFKVSPAAASQLVMEQQPNYATAGLADNPPIIVYVEDQFDNVVTGKTFNVTLNVATGPGTLSGAGTVGTSKGVATFGSASLKTAGTYTLTATRHGLTSATTAGITVYPAVAAKLVFSQQPSNATAGVADSPAIIVDVEDALGNVVTTDDSDVTLAVQSGPGAASGVLSVAAVDGVATFSDVMLDTIGKYALQATDGFLSDVTSKSFTVV